MRYTIIGCGAVGLEIARAWTAEGHFVRGTTTTPERLPELTRACTESVVLQGADMEKVKLAVDGSDAVVLAVRPRSAVGMATPRERGAEHRTTLSGTARSVVMAHHRVLLLSTIAVYGDASDQPADTPVDETTPRTATLEPVALNYAAAERAVLESVFGVVLRLPDVYGHPSLPVPERVRLAHELSGGKVPFLSTALAYRIHYLDAAAAARAAIEHDLRGIYNAVPDQPVPDSNEVALGRLTDSLGYPRLTFTDEIRTPTRPISSARLRASGFTFTHSEAL